MSIITAVLLGAVLTTPPAKVVKVNRHNPQPLTSESTYQVDTFVLHYHQMVAGQPTYLSYVVLEGGYTQAEAVARALEITKNGTCWGETVLNCYPSHNIQRVVVHQLPE
jgi:hypothetical protein